MAYQSAFNLPYGSPRDITPEMLKAGQSPLTFVASSTDTENEAVATVASVDASSYVVVWGISCVTAETTLHAWQLSEGTDYTVANVSHITVAGATNSGPFFYSFDTPHLCTKGNDLFISGLVGGETSYCTVYYSTVVAHQQN